MPLTDMAVRTAKPGENDYWLSDERGLRLLVTSKGARYWRLKYRFDGKQKTLALGVYPDVSLKKARERRDEARTIIADNMDPSAKKKADNASRKLSASNTFASLAGEWWERNKDTWTEKHASRTWQRLKDNALDSFGSCPINDVSPQMILEAIREIEDRKAYDVARRVLQDISRIYDYGVQIGRTSYNPAQSLRGIVKAPKSQHLASLSQSELPGLLKDLTKYGERGRRLTQLAIELLILTFVRPGELRGAYWCEIDFTERLWRIPASRMKMKSDHIVPMSHQAIAVLEQIQEITGKYDLIFPSERNRSLPMSDNTMRKAMFTMGYDGKTLGKSKAVPHGFRATASSILNENGFNPDAIERQLAHMERNGVRAAYTHHAQYLEERKKLMQWWADFLDIQAQKI